MAEEGNTQEVVPPPTDIRTPEVERESFLESPFNQVIMARARAEAEGQEDPRAWLEGARDNAVLADALNAIDQQAYENYDQLQPDNAEGAAFPMTHINVREIATKLGISLPEPQEGHPSAGEKRTYVVIPGFDPPAQQDHAMASWEAVYDRVFTSLRRVANGADVDIRIIGYPYGAGGKMTEAWAKKVEDEGFAAYGEALGQQVSEMTRESHKVVINGHSMGAKVAESISAYLDQDTKDKTTLLLDSPAITNNVLQGARMVAALATGALGPLSFKEMGARAKAMVPHKEFLMKLAREKGLDVPTAGNEEAAHDKLGKKSFTGDLLRIVKGKAGMTGEGDVRAFVRANWFAEALGNPRRFIEHYVRREKGELQVFDDQNSRWMHVPTDEKHVPDRLDYKKWTGIVTALSGTTEPSAEAA